MDDPCTRKSTNPKPVFAPKRKNSEPGQSDENKKLKTILEKDLDLSERILEQDLALSDCEVNNGNETSVTDPKVATKETETAVKNLIDIIVEDAVSEERNELMGKTSKFTSKEYISSSSEDEDSPTKQSKESMSDKMKLISEKIKSSFKEPERRTKVIPSKNKNQCKYIFVKGPRKGERCTNFTNSVFCLIHSKNVEKKEKEPSNGGDRKVRDLQIATQELYTKIDHILTSKKEEKNANDYLKKKISELENKISSLNNQKKKAESCKPMKLHKVNKRLTYEFIGFDEGKNLKLQTGTKIISVIPPKSLTVPKETNNVKFKYNSEDKCFEFMKI